MNSSMILSITTFVYALAAFFYIYSWVFKKPVASRIALWVTVLGIIANTAGILLRWVASYDLGFGHAPFSNLYESLVFFAWTIAVIFVIIERKYKMPIIGTFTVPLAFLAMAYASLNPNISEQIQPLLPALKSNWLIAHVIACFVGYAAFAISFGLGFMYILRGLIDLNLFSIRGRLSHDKFFDVFSIYFVLNIGFLGISFLLISFLNDLRLEILLPLVFLFLLLFVVIINLVLISQVIRRIHDLGKSGANWLRLLIPLYNIYFLFELIFENGTNGPNDYGPPDQYYDDASNFENPFSKALNIIPKLNILDELNYNMVIFGFLFLTIGIITGAVWANSAWGRYWGWDPKETWSLITWIIYATLLHARNMRGWRGKRIAWFSIIGFAAVMITYFGVNYLPGLHSYGSM